MKCGLSTHPKSYSSNPSWPAGLVQPQILHQNHSSSPFLQNLPTNQSGPPPPDNNLLHQQILQHQNSFVGNIDSPLRSLLGSAHQDDSGWPAKCVALNPLLPNLTPIDQVGLSNASMAHNLPPFPGRECMIEQEGSNDPQNHFLFGVNIDSSSLLMQNSMSNLKGVTVSENENGFASSSYMSGSGADYSLNFPNVNTNGCIAESGFLPSSDNGEHANPPPDRAFVKVYKSGSFGRSLDLTKFSSYHELRSELAQMFGLEDQLEDSLRSGGQLVFVDRENDVLLLGDDPWPEFVNSVWCIKILSPEEVQEMRKRGLQLLNSVPLQKLPYQNGGCGNYTNRQESRNMNAGIPCVGTLDF